jgi:CheY-like chemotaxis protein
VGLALVKGLAELHGGSVTAHSDGLGRGSEFTLILPLAANRPAAGGPALEAPSSIAGCRVLVVDDNRDGADALAMTLQFSGQTARVAYDGASALATAQAFRPDIAVLDIGMPGMDGYELARRLRAEPWSKDLVLIALTGWGQQHDRDRASQAGFDHHLTKPADPAEMSRLIALHRPSARAIERNALGFELEAGDALGKGE